MRKQKLSLTDIEWFDKDFISRGKSRTSFPDSECEALSWSSLNLNLILWVKSLRIYWNKMPFSLEFQEKLNFLYPKTLADYYFPKLSPF
jgi:hypothetical protein